MKNYWKTYVIVLLAYIVFGIIWIEIIGNMTAFVKIVVTLACMSFLTEEGLRELNKLGINKWKFLLAVPISIVLWALFVDALTGLYFHEGIFYLGNSWPDSLIKMPGELYFILKGCAAIVFSPLLIYIK